MQAFPRNVLAQGVDELLLGPSGLLEETVQHGLDLPGVVGIQLSRAAAGLREYPIFRPTLGRGSFEPLGVAVFRCHRLLAFLVKAFCLPLCESNLPAAGIALMDEKLRYELARVSSAREGHWANSTVTFLHMTGCTLDNLWGKIISSMER